MMQARVFRRLDSIRYRGAIHEQLNNSRGNLRALVNNDWQIYHTGYSASSSRQKAERNLALLKERAKAVKNQEEMAQLTQLLDLDFFEVEWFDVRIQATVKTKYYANDYDTDLLSKSRGLYQPFEVNLVPVSKRRY